jgi:hypothetical protein
LNLYLKNAVWVILTVVVSFWVGVIFAKLFPNIISDGFIEWLHHWQELVGAIVGAGALAATVGWTLRAERRKRDIEFQAMRVALGAELRQFAQIAAEACRRIVAHWEKAPKTGAATFPAFALEDMLRFTDPVIYPNVAADLGALGEPALRVVFFFSKIAAVRDGLRTIMREGQYKIVTVEQIFEFAKSLIVANDALTTAWPAFAETPLESERNDDFAAAVLKARDDLYRLKGAIDVQLAAGTVS